MKCLIILPACLLLLWTLTAFVSCEDGSAEKIKVKTVSDGIELSCADENQNITRKSSGESEKSMKLPYKDENSGEYMCVLANGETGDAAKIYVKFRTCDNCIELDVSSMMGIVVGDVVATIVIGVAVYLFASQTRIGPVTSHKKSSDRQHLVPNEVSSSSSSRAPNDHYQPLKHKGGQKETYDVLTNRR